MSKPTIGIYVRVSTAHQVEEGFSLEEQRESLIEDAERRGYDWEMFEDPGISGQTLDQRPEAIELLQQIESGELVGVLARFSDRLYRSEPALAEMLIRLTQAGAKLIEHGGSELDLTKSGDVLQAWIKGIFSVHDNRQRTERMIHGLRRAVKAGFWPGGPAPYGYRLVDDPNGSKHQVLEIDEVQAAVIRRATRLILVNGLSTYRTCQMLNTEGVRTERGSHWRHPNLRRHLRKPHLTGIWTYKPRDAGEITMKIPAILDQETWDQLQEAIQGSPRPQRKHRTYPLTGRNRKHLRCDCGGNYSGKSEPEKPSVYVCSGSAHEFGVERCPHTPRSVRRAEIEDALLNELRPVFTEDYLLQLAEAAFPDPDTFDYENEIRKINAQIDRRKAEKIRLARKLAEDERGLDFLGEAIADIEDEVNSLLEERTRLEQRREAQVHRSTIEEQIEHISKQMASKLDYLADEDYAKLADLLQIELERVGSQQFVGSASVPLDLGDIHESGPQRLYSNLTGLTFEVTVLV